MKQQSISPEESNPSRTAIPVCSYPHCIQGSISCLECHQPQSLKDVRLLRSPNQVSMAPPLQQPSPWHGPVFPLASGSWSSTFYFDLPRTIPHQLQTSSRHFPPQYYWLLTLTCSAESAPLALLPLSLSTSNHQQGIGQLFLPIRFLIQAYGEVLGSLVHCTNCVNCSKCH